LILGRVEMAGAHSAHWCPSPLKLPRKGVPWDIYRDLVEQINRDVYSLIERKPVDDVRLQIPPTALALSISVQASRLPSSVSCYGTAPVRGIVEGLEPHCALRESATF
jgi:hypothetical protein